MISLYDFSCMVESYLMECVIHKIQKVIFYERETKLNRNVKSKPCRTCYFTTAAVTLYIILVLANSLLIYLPVLD